MATPKVLLIVLDGFGDGKDYPFNAITHSRMPFYRSLTTRYPKAQLLTSGEAVGLPPGVMGNSEVGHMNMGAGRIVYQDLTRIDKSIREKQFQKNHGINATIQKVKLSRGRLHLFGLLSDAGVHSHLSHLKAILEMCEQEGVPAIVHAFTDGRDTPPQSGLQYAKALESFVNGLSLACIGSVSGRYFAMDRDQRWDRVAKAWSVLIGKAAPSSLSASAVIEKSYESGITDEFIEPTLLSSPRQSSSAVRDGDGIFFYNFRADRARQLTRAFTQKDFHDFETGQRPQLAAYLCMTEYDKTFGLPVAFPPQNLTQMLPDVLAAHHLKQFRIAETEKYAHVTFFFNGSREKPYEGEQRILIASPKDVPTYDLKPEMSAPEVTQRLVARIEKGEENFMLVNYANPDMVGHTGNYEAAIKALETIDACLEKVVTAAIQSHYSVFITADHGNVEEMRECDHLEQIHTQHTLNPVPVHFISADFHYKLREGGVLADIAPSILEIMGLEKPAEMSGKSLLVGSR